jgi:hypothetical protein
MVLARGATERHPAPSEAIAETHGTARKDPGKGVSSLLTLASRLAK